MLRILTCLLGSLIIPLWSWYLPLPKGKSPVIFKTTNSSKYLEFDEAILSNGPEYPDNSIFRDGEYFKLSIPANGIYKIDYEFLSQFVDIQSIDPRQISLFGHPGGALIEAINEISFSDPIELAIHIEGESDGQFDQSDYVLFYAEGPDRVELNSQSKEFRKTLNIYSRQANVFLRIGPELGKRISLQNNIENVDNPSQSSDWFEHIEENNFNLLGSFSSTQGSGQQWFDRIMTNQRSFDLSDEFHLNDIDLESEVDVKLSFAGRSASATNVQLKIDGNDYSSRIGPVKVGDVEATYARQAIISERQLLSTVNSKIIVEYPETSIGSEGWMDYLTIQYQRFNTFDSQTRTFIDFSSVDRAVSGFDIKTDNQNIVVWDITDNMKPVIQEFEANNTGISFGYNSELLRQFLAFDPNQIINIPLYEGKIEPQNLHSIQDVDFVIVYHKDFADAALRLSEHRQNQGLKVLTVDVAEIYNEFAAGKQDPTAIRNFAKMIFDRSPVFNSLLLLGDGSYDYTGISQGLDFQSFVPAYETKESLNPLSAFPTDDYFALLSDNEGANLRGAIDIAVGRIPVKTKAEADAVIGKIISYDNSSDRFGDWRLRVTFAADDEDSNIHLRQADGIAEKTEIAHPIFNQGKIYFDAFVQESTPGGARYPAANSKLNNEIFNGLLVTNYMGHGGPKGWSQERVLKVADIVSWTNKDALPLIITATCSFTGFDDPAIVTAGEEAILNPNGGAVALYSTVRSVYSSQNERLTKSVFDTLFSKVDGVYMTIGETLRRAKNSNSADTININSRKFLLIGDPSMHLAIPKYNIKTQLINSNVQGTNLLDTIKALDEVTIKGNIVDDEGRTVEDYNGIIYPTLFDKPIRLQTLVNDRSSFEREFDVQQNKLFRGAASVTNGEFSFSFVVPVDIDYSFGKGKLSYYSTDGDKDAAGYFDQFIIGGTSDTEQLDDSPPVVQAFLNTYEFKSGDESNSSPLLLANISDDKGINFTGVSIGHDITAIIDGNTQNTIILNEFYSSDLDNAKSGKIRYPMDDLAPGKHSLTIKAFDVANNPGEATIEFYVLESEAYKVYGLSAYPNPASEQITFEFKHDFINQPIWAAINIYSVSGQLLHTINTNKLSSVDGFNTFTWQTASSMTDIASGLYFYNVKILSPELNISKESSFEKVVILK